MRQNKKRKLLWRLLPKVFKILMYIGLFVGALMVARFISFAIEGYDFIPRVHLWPNELIYGFQYDRHTRFIFFGISVLIVVAILFFSMGGKKSTHYESEMVEITDAIKTPIAVGQSQHGSARWQTEAQIDKTFASYTLDRRKNGLVKRLIKEGRDIRVDMKMAELQAAKATKEQEAVNAAEKQDTVTIAKEADTVTTAKEADTVTTAKKRKFAKKAKEQKPNRKRKGGAGHDK